MEIKKIIGWLTFFVGLSIIFFSLYSSFNIFTGKEEPPEVFKPKEKLPVSSEVKMPTTPTEIQKQIQMMIFRQLEEMLPTNVIPTMLNLFIWSMLAGTLIFGGGQIANLGIKLIKK